MAEAHGVSDIADMSHALANLFRASISESTPTVPLRNELDYLNSYIQIQLMRFKNQIQFNSSCDSSCMELMIPKLSIQPLVENAIKHGIEESGESCDIILFIQKEKNGTRVSVANTGSRFDDDMERKLLHPSEASKDLLAVHGIGLKNINERLQLIYGTECHLKFTNENNYAVVYFIIPGGIKNV